MADSTDQPQSGQDAARGTQAQLERVAAKTNVPATRFPEDEARLKSVRPDIQNPPANAATDAAAPASGATSNDLITQKVIEILTSLATDPFTLVKLSVRDAQQTALENDLRSGSQTPSASDPNARTDSNDPHLPVTDSTSAAIASPTTPGPGAPLPNLPVPQPQSQNDLADVIAGAGKVSDAGRPLLAGSGSASNTSSDNFSGAADEHAQALQVSGARMQAVLQQNTQFTVSLFDQIMSLIDAQNGALAEMSRKVSELGGQIKSLKNP